MIEIIKSVLKKNNFKVEKMEINENMIELYVRKVTPIEHINVMIKMNGS